MRAHIAEVVKAWLFCKLMFSMLIFVTEIPWSFLDIENLDGCYKIYECKYKLFAALMESFSPLSLSPCIRAGVHRNAEYFA